MARKAYSVPFCNLRLPHYFLNNPSLLVQSALIIGDEVALGRVVKAFPLLGLTLNVRIESARLYTRSFPPLSFKEYFSFVAIIKYWLQKFDHSSSAVHSTE